MFNASSSTFPAPKPILGLQELSGLTDREYALDLGQQGINHIRLILRVLTFP
jgi:hypothetical protein